MLHILDNSIPQVRAAAQDLPLADLQALLEAEENGKTRKGVVAALEELIEARRAESESLADAIAFDCEAEVEAVLPGVTVHLGDGRKLTCGERAVVDPEIAAVLIERGQAK